MSAVEKKARNRESEARRIEAIRRAWADTRRRAEQAERIMLAKSAAADVERLRATFERARNSQGGTAYYPTPANAARRASSIRPCLNCRQDFRSQGPGNRLCPKCRVIPVSPFEL